MKLWDILPSPYKEIKTNYTHVAQQPYTRHHASLDMEQAERAAKSKLGFELGEHWGIVGGTGSGKTTGAVALLEYLRRHNPNVKRYVHDASYDPDAFGQVYNPLHVMGNKAPDLLTNELHTQVWTPKSIDLDENETWFSRHVDAREPSIVLVDEAAAVKDVESFVTLLKWGRKHKTTVIVCTQKIAKVPSEIFDMCTHFMQFRLNRNPYEWQRSRELLNILQGEQKAPDARYGFFYRRLDGPYTSKEYMDYKQFFGHSLLYKQKGK